MLIVLIACCADPQRPPSVIQSEVTDVASRNFRNTSDPSLAKKALYLLPSYENTPRTCRFTLSPVDQGMPCLTTTYGGTRGVLLYRVGDHGAKLAADRDAE